MKGEADIMRNWSIGTKVSTAAFAIVSAAFLVFVVLIGVWTARLAETGAVREVSDKTHMLVRTVEIVDSDLRRQVGIFGNVFKSYFPQGFRIDAGTTVDVAGEATPALSSGKQVNLDFSIPDRFTELTGVYATVFVRRGDDFIRVTTSHKKENGERAIGTRLDHAHPGYRKVLDGHA